MMQSGEAGKESNGVAPPRGGTIASRGVSPQGRSDPGGPETGFGLLDQTGTLDRLGLFPQHFPRNRLLVSGNCPGGLGSLMGVPPAKMMGFLPGTNNRTLEAG